MLEGLERDLRNVPVGKAVVATVIANEAVAVGEEMQQRRAERALPFPLDMAHPVGGSCYGQALADARDGNIDAVLGPAKRNLLSAHGMMFDARVSSVSF